MKVFSVVVFTLSLLLSQGLVYRATAQVGAARPVAPAPATVPASPAPPVVPALEPTPSNLAIAAATKSGVPITTVSDLSSSISVEAVVIPYNVAKRVFGKEIASKYSVVSLIVSNRDAKQGAVVHSIFLDYSKWLFSGIFAGLKEDAKADIRVWQAQTDPSQVASAEVRTVRTDFQDAQLWSARNFVLHIATSVGTAAAAVSFATANDLFAPSVAAWNGAVVPALGVIWPDNSQTQLNLLNDIGFRTNKVIAAKSSDIIVAFFPQERFLTPRLQKIYRDAPAAFFNPSELILERSGAKSDHNFLGIPKKSEVEKLMSDIGDLGIITQDTCPGSAQNTVKTTQCGIVKSVVHYEAAYSGIKSRVNATQPDLRDPTILNPCGYIGLAPSDLAKDSDKATYKAIVDAAKLIDADCLNVELLNRISLNRIRVVVGGIMTIDVAAIPATISSVQIANEKQLATWKKDKKIIGTISGTFLNGASVAAAITPLVAGGTAPKLASLQVDTANANDTTLPFSATINDADIVPGTKLVFTVTKTAQDKSVTASAPFTYTVNTDLELGTPSGTFTADAGVVVTVTGTGLTGANITPRSESGSPSAGKFSTTIDTAKSTDSTFVFTVKSSEAVTSKTVIDLVVTRADGSITILRYTAP